MEILKEIKNIHTIKLCKNIHKYFGSSRESNPRIDLTRGMVTPDDKIKRLPYQLRLPATGISIVAVNI